MKTSRLIMVICESKGNTGLRHLRHLGRYSTQWEPNAIECLARREYAGIVAAGYTGEYYFIPANPESAEADYLRMEEVGELVYEHSMRKVGHKNYELVKGVDYGA